jgi:hypothetical protein
MEGELQGKRKGRLGFLIRPFVIMSSSEFSISFPSQFLQSSLRLIIVMAVPA